MTSGFLPGGCRASLLARTNHKTRLRITLTLSFLYLPHAAMGFRMGFLVPCGSFLELGIVLQVLWCGSMCVYASIC